MTRIDDAMTEMVETMKAVHELVAHVQAAFAANQIGLVAIAEQLVRSGRLDAVLTAKRMRESAIGPLVSLEAARAIAILASDIEALGEGTTPSPPRGLRRKLMS